MNTPSRYSRIRSWGEDGADTLIGGFGNDSLTGGEGADSFLYHNVHEDGHDTITDFAGADVVDLDALFDELGIASADDRASTISIDLVDGNSILTIAQKGPYAEFSITFDGVSLAEGDAAGLEAQGVLVGIGDES